MNCNAHQCSNRLRMVSTYQASREPHTGTGHVSLEAIVFLKLSNTTTSSHHSSTLRKHIGVYTTEQRTQAFKKIVVRDILIAANNLGIRSQIVISLHGKFKNATKHAYVTKRASQLHQQEKTDFWIKICVCVHPAGVQNVLDSKSQII